MFKTLDLIEAAALLKMTPGALRKKAADGIVPGAKPGKKWCFREDHLAYYLQSIYPDAAKTLQGVTMRNKSWHSTKEVKYGGLKSHTMESEYKKLLGLQIG